MSKSQKPNREKLRKLQSVDIPSTAILWDVPTMQSELHISRYLAMKLGRESKAIFRIGNRIFFDMEKVAAHVDSITK